MKNSFIIIIIFFYFCTTAIAENLNIQSSNISIDKKTRLSLFKGEVVTDDIKIPLKQITLNMIKILSFLQV